MRKVAPTWGRQQHVHQDRHHWHEMGPGNKYDDHDYDLATVWWWFKWIGNEYNGDYDDLNEMGLGNQYDDDD